MHFTLVCFCFYSFWIPRCPPCLSPHHMLIGLGLRPLLISGTVTVASGWGASDVLTAGGDPPHPHTSGQLSSASCRDDSGPKSHGRPGPWIEVKPARHSCFLAALRVSEDYCKCLCPRVHPPPPECVCPEGLQVTRKKAAYVMLFNPFFSCNRVIIECRQPPPRPSVLEKPILGALPVRSPCSVATAWP